MAVGFGFYVIANFSTALVLVTLILIRPIERRFFRRTRARQEAGDSEVS